MCYYSVIMAINHSIWKVGLSPQALAETSLASERILEDMIVASPDMLSNDWMLIGRQENTGYGGRIDLLAMAPDGSLVLIELKRDRTPRDVVAQALDYASWVQSLLPQDISVMYKRFTNGKNLEDDFRSRFGQQLSEDSLNQSHQIVIVSSSIDDSTERIIKYLAGASIPINVLCFKVFSCGADQFLSRVWLVDPLETQISATSGTVGDHEPWNGEFYASFGVDGGGRSWDEACKYGFISAGGGVWYTRTLKLLKPGDRIWVKAPGHGFLGVGKVTGEAQPAPTFSFVVPEGAKRVLDVLKGGHYHREFAKDLEKCEYFVPVNWLDVVPLSQAVNEVGLFGNQNTVCQPTTPKWRYTVERLKEKFPSYVKL